MGETETRGEETKIFKRWEKLSQGMGALKRRAGILLQTVLTPSTPKHHMTLFCGQIELRVPPNLLNSVSP